MHTTYNITSAERMTLPSAVMALLILYSTKLAGIEAGTLTISTIPSPPVLGTTGFKVRCTYGVNANEIFRTINIMSSMKLNAKFFVTIIFIDEDGSASWSQKSTPESLRNRATLFYSKSSKYIEIRFPTTKCEDINTQYFFKLTIMERSTRNVVEKKEKITIGIEAHPEYPSPIEVTNAVLSSCVEPGTKVTFLCSANVGRPASNSGLLWYLVKEDGTIHDVTARATETGSELLTGEPSCTFRKRSTLTMTFDRRYNPGKTSVRCAVKHPDVNYALCTNPSVHFCQRAPDVCLKGVAMRNDDYSGDTGTGTGTGTGTDSDADADTNTGTDNTEGESGDGGGKGGSSLSDTDVREDKTKAKGKGKAAATAQSTQAANEYTTPGTSAVTIILSIMGGMAAMVFLGMAAYFMWPRKSTAVSRRHDPSVGDANTPAGIMVSVSQPTPPTSPSMGSGYYKGWGSEYAAAPSSQFSHSTSQYSSNYVDDDQSSAYSSQSSIY